MATHFFSWKMDSRDIARSLTFFSKSLASSDQDALTHLVEEYFTCTNEEEQQDGKFITAQLNSLLLNTSKNVMNFIDFTIQLL